MNQDGKIVTLDYFVMHIDKTRIDSCGVRVSHDGVALTLTHMCGLLVLGVYNSHTSAQLYNKSYIAKTIILI